MLQQFIQQKNAELEKAGLLEEYRNVSKYASNACVPWEERKQILKKHNEKLMAAGISQGTQFVLEENRWPRDCGINCSHRKGV
jgi:isopentenyl diphosphate isomerase/L-lactate dehydrogenase-like FMN-dependent dehydrogenase